MNHLKNNNQIDASKHEMLTKTDNRVPITDAFKCNKI
jgi:hypothetical protein